MAATWTGMVRRLLMMTLRPTVVKVQCCLRWIYNKTIKQIYTLADLRDTIQQEICQVNSRRKYSLMCQRDPLTGAKHSACCDKTKHKVKQRRTTQNVNNNTRKRKNTQKLELWNN